MKIAILGAGAFGTALGGILADNGYDIDYYDPKIEKESLSQVLENAKIIYRCNTFDIKSKEVLKGERKYWRNLTFPDLLSVPMQAFLLQRTAISMIMTRKTAVVPSLRPSP